MKRVRLTRPKSGRRQHATRGKDPHHGVATSPPVPDRQIIGCFLFSQVPKQWGGEKEYETTPTMVMLGMGRGL